MLQPVQHSQGIVCLVTETLANLMGILLQMEEQEGWRANTFSSPGWVLNVSEQGWNVVREAA